MFPWMRIEARGTIDFTRGSACTDWKSWKRIKITEVFPDGLRCVFPHWVSLALVSDAGPVDKIPVTHSGAGNSVKAYPRQVANAPEPVAKTLMLMMASGPETLAEQVNHAPKILSSPLR